MNNKTKMLKTHIISYDRSDYTIVSRTTVVALKLRENNDFNSNEHLRCRIMYVFRIGKGQKRFCREKANGEPSTAFC